MKLSGFALFAGLTSSTAAQAVKVMLLGDSITEITCWRPLVWEQITSAGLAGSVDFVGSMNDLQPQCSRPQGFDPDHEGHSGWQAYDIARNNIVGWVQNTKPDIVQFMLGTNDVNIGHRNADSIIGSYTIMLNAMRAANPRVKVIVDKMIPTSWSDATIEAVNNAIPGWVLQQTTAESPVVIADCSRAAGFTNDMLRDDGVHPNSKGDQFIAGQIGPKLIQLIKDVSTGTTSSTSTSSTSPTSTSGGSGTGAAHWGQCGGIGWNGPTTCVSPYTCQQINTYYYQCL